MRRAGRLAAAAVLVAGPAAGEPSSLRFFNWVDYIDPSVVADFEAETGIDVVVETYTSSEQVETRLLLGAGGVDLAVVYSQQIDRLARAGAIEPFDLALTPNSAGVDGTIKALMPGAAADENLTLPYFWGTTGVGYNVGELTRRFPEGPPSSLGLIFDPDVASRVEDCGIHVIDAPETVIGAALAWLGRDPRSRSPEDVDAAVATIEAAATRWRAIDSELINALATGASCVTLAWSTEVLLAQEDAVEGVEVGYLLPDEGVEIWVDSLAIPKGAANRLAAHRFADFLLRPDIAARLTNWSHAANAVPASAPGIDPEILDNPGVYPKDIDRDRFYPLPAFDLATQAAVNSRWMWLKLPR